MLLNWQLIFAVVLFGPTKSVVDCLKSGSFIPFRHGEIFSVLPAFKKKPALFHRTFVLPMEREDETEIVAGVVCVVWGGLQSRLCESAFA